jgi:prepilin-type N-terminal cleavage/methylation domain-containing protein
VRKNRKGFTLIELVIVIAILGILALYAVPKYQGLIEEARSSEARAQLGTVRSALGIYYAKNHGKYPAVLDGTIFAEGVVPEVEATDTNGNVVRVSIPVVQITLTDSHPFIVLGDSDDKGGWVYGVNTSVLSDGTPAYGKADVRINAKGLDSITGGKYWYQY